MRILGVSELALEWVVVQWVVKISKASFNRSVTI